ncbi:MAG TPA: zinc ABC transporter substrate-binding protein [Acidimicrobiales bacterium]|jgi:zinc/manganese transport system substrate-binding protein|nr:zinc ABC transporter substrate-binding protein [Acidimicrobiales bacterium]
MRPFPLTRFPRVGIAAAVLVTLALLLGACSSSASPGGGSLSVSSGKGVIEVVAAENFWGSIAAQIGGQHVHVVSIITNPNTDPHVYEPTASDGRTLAGAQMVIENGIGYDPWVPQLLKSAGSKATVLNVGDLLGVADGGNPHRWYNPTDTQTVIAQVTADYQKLDPADAAYFAQQQSAFNTVALKQYDSLIASIKATYGGTLVGASESIFSMLAPALGLNLITPYSFLRAISEGTEVTAADKQTIDAQIQQHQIKIYVYNSQNVTPDVQAQLQEVKAAHIPYATITESLQPASSTYQAWQTRQLLGIQSALAQATG